MTQQAAADRLRLRLHELKQRNRATAASIARDASAHGLPVSRQTVYNVLKVAHVPRADTLIAICSALEATDDDILAILGLARQVETERGLWKRGVTERASTVAQQDQPDVDFLFRRFDGRSGHHRQQLKWTYVVGRDRWGDHVTERRRVWVDGHEPVESVLAHPGSAHERDVRASDLGARVRVLELPSGTPDDVTHCLYVGAATDHSIGLLTIFSQPISQRGWLDVEFSYRWPGLWDSLRDPRERVSHGWLGFIGDVERGAIEIVSHRPVDLAIDGATSRPRTASRRGWYRALHGEPHPARFDVTLTR